MGEAVGDKFYYPRLSCALSSECDVRSFQCPYYDCELAEMEAECEECKVDRRCSCYKQDNDPKKGKTGEKGRNEIGFKSTF